MLPGEPNLTGEVAAKWINAKLGLGEEDSYSTSKESYVKKKNLSLDPIGKKRVKMCSFFDSFW